MNEPNVYLTREETKCILDVLYTIKTNNTYFNILNKLLSLYKSFAEKENKYIYASEFETWYKLNPNKIVKMPEWNDMTFNSYEHYNQIMTDTFKQHPTSVVTENTDVLTSVVDGEYVWTPISEFIQQNEIKPTRKIKTVKEFIEWYKQNPDMTVVSDGIRWYNYDSFTIKSNSHIMDTLCVKNMVVKDKNRSSWSYITEYDCVD